MISGMWKNVICVGTGNEGNTGGHISGKLGQQEERILEFGISQQEPVMNIQLWKSYVDQFQIILIHPDGESFECFRSVLEHRESWPGIQRF